MAFYCSRSHRRCQKVSSWSHLSCWSPTKGHDELQQETEVNQLISLLLSCYLSYLSTEGWSHRTLWRILMKGVESPRR
jgi:hypothetical protein